MMNEKEENEPTPTADGHPRLQGREWLALWSELERANAFAPDMMRLQRLVEHFVAQRVRIKRLQRLRRRDQRAFLAADTPERFLAQIEALAGDEEK